MENASKGRREREDGYMVCMCVFCRWGQSERWLTIEVGPRMEDKNWEKGVSFKAEGEIQQLS